MNAEAYAGLNPYGLPYLTGFFFFFLESTACQQFVVVNIFVKGSLDRLQIFVSGYKYLIL